MDEQGRARRPGGRSARVRAAVHQAVTELVRERGYGNFTVGDIAARAGVADTSLYRRWGNLQALLGDVLLTRLNARSPMPDTGSLAGDLRTHAANVAREVTGPDGLALVRLTIALSGEGQLGLQARDQLLADRTGSCRPCSPAPATAASTRLTYWTCSTISWHRSTSASCSARARSPRTTSPAWSTGCSPDPVRRAVEQPLPVDRRRRATRPGRPGQGRGHRPGSSPLGHAHLNCLGRYATASFGPTQGLRALGQIPDLPDPEGAEAGTGPDRKVRVPRRVQTPLNQRSLPVSPAGW